MTISKSLTQPIDKIGTWLSEAGRPSWRVLALLSALACVTVLLVWFGLVRSLGNEGSGAPKTEAANLTIRELLPVLTRSGFGPEGVGLDATYAPRRFFEVTGQTPPDGNVLTFFLQENIHEGVLPLSPPQAYLMVDGAGQHLPTEAEVVNNDIHHRITRLLFPAEVVGNVSRTISLAVPMEDGTVSSGNMLTWELPLRLPDGAMIGLETSTAVDTGEPDEAIPGVSLSTMTKVLREVRQSVTYGGVEGIEIAATYATPEYFAAAFPPAAETRYAPDQFAVFVVSETSHTADLPVVLPTLLLQYKGRTYEPDLIERKASSPHHRVTMLRFPLDPGQINRADMLELRLPDGSGLRWQLPITYQEASGTSPFGLTWASILAILAGVLAAMWPCLFQLTVFFIPTLAGLGMDETSGEVTLGRRLEVVKAAFFFVLGFTLVYTVAGALVGLTAQQLGESADFETWQRYIGIVGGIVIFLLALRVAVRVRAPLVCKMPILSRMSTRQRQRANPLEMMVAGLAFATGCMTCFGAALVITMVVYVGLSGSVAFGALIMFLFSLGMGIPLVIAATAMAQVLPLLFRLEKVLPWMGLASSLLMMGFALLLISGHYMALTEWVYQITNVSALP